ncbi:hypothetical protein D4L85_24920 [Chryseolinea soli]|uniref:Uncharacterized protein n=1 Tax=Chryseolinea soli TaxID=2321403 RepID=A0A385SUH2_9BACT|nr:hypothetical protein D4L85_24920 [Chryseolinea soli]
MLAISMALDHEFFFGATHRHSKRNQDHTLELLLSEIVKNYSFGNSIRQRQGYLLVLCSYYLIFANSRHAFNFDTKCLYPATDDACG